MRAFVSCIIGDIHGIFDARYVTKIMTGIKKAFKYNIAEQVKSLPRSITNIQLVHVLKKYGIAERTFYRDKSLRIGDAEDLPVERLMIYTIVFDCELTDLINYKVKAKPIVPIDQRIKSPLS